MKNLRKIRSCAFLSLFILSILGYPRSTYASATLASHFLSHTQRILWQGETLFNKEHVYCVVTDDDKLFTFAEDPNVSDDSIRMPLATLDLSLYNRVTWKEGSSQTIILSSIDPDNKLCPQTFTFSDASPDLLHIFRVATHQYYYYDERQKQLLPLKKRSPHSTMNYHLLEITCHTTKSASRKVPMCCLFPQTYQVTYQGFCELLSNYLGTYVESFQRKGQDVDLSTNECPLPFNRKEENMFTLVLAPTINFRYFTPNYRSSKKNQQVEALNPLSPKSQQKKRGLPARRRNIIFLPPNKAFHAKNRMSVNNGDDEKSTEDTHPFINQKDFISMEPIRLDEQDPLDKLVDPRLPLNSLIQELIANDSNGSLLGDIVEEKEVEAVKERIQSVKYLTKYELPWLGPWVEDKMGCDEHKALGAPLDLVEICAIALYTNTNRCSQYLCSAQRCGNFTRCPLWDEYLMKGIFKLHQKERKTNRVLYSGLERVSMRDMTMVGFFKTYTSTSFLFEKAMEFKGWETPGMLLFLVPEMLDVFPNCQVDWISRFPHEKEVLFARSSDIGWYAPPKWQATVFEPTEEQEQVGKESQCVRLTPFSKPLIVPKNETYCLSSGNYTFSYIKVGENATLRTDAWAADKKKGGSLSIECKGDCRIEKGACINLKGLGYTGGTKTHRQGYGPGGGYGGERCCAAGGSHRTQGSDGSCQEAFTQRIYHAKAVQKKLKTVLGSGGGYIQYSDEDGEEGTAGGGGLRLIVHGDLQLDEGSQLCADGGDANTLTGGAGSGGSLYVEVKGKLSLSSSKTTTPYFTARGGDNHNTHFHYAQGCGGAGYVTLLLHNEIDLGKRTTICCQPYPLFILKSWLRSYAPAMYPINIQELILWYLPNTRTRTLQLPYTPLTNDNNHLIVTFLYYVTRSDSYDIKLKEKKAIQDLENCLSITEKLYGQEPNRYHAVVMKNLGRIYLGKKGIHYLLKSIAEYDKLEKTDIILTEQLTCRTSLAFIYSRLNKHTLALKQLDIVFQTPPDLFQHLPKEQLLQRLIDMGMACSEAKKHKKALRYFEKVLQKDYFVLLGQNTLANLYCQIAKNYALLKRYDKAIQYDIKFLETLGKGLKIESLWYRAQQRASRADLDKRIQALIEKDKKIFKLAVPFNNLGRSYLKQKVFPEALYYLKIALKIKQADPHISKCDIATSLNNIGACLLEMKVLDDETFKYFNQARKKEEAAHSEDLSHPHVIDAYESIGIFCMERGDYKKASKYFEKYLTQQSNKKSIQEKLSTCYNHRGCKLLKEKKHRKAIDCFNKDLKIQKIISGGKDTLNIGNLYHYLATAHTELGEYDTSRGLYQNAYHIYRKELGEKHTYTQKMLFCMRGIDIKKGTV
ncbi:MAG: tetratricopeptide repeat protein [Bacteroidota bacterium]